MGKKPHPHRPGRLTRAVRGTVRTPNHRGACRGRHRAWRPRRTCLLGSVDGSDRSVGLPVRGYGSAFGPTSAHGRDVRDDALHSSVTSMVGTCWIQDTQAQAKTGPATDLLPIYLSLPRLTMLLDGRNARRRIGIAWRPHRRVSAGGSLHRWGRVDGDQRRRPIERRMRCNCGPQVSRPFVNPSDRKG